MRFAIAAVILSVVILGSLPAQTPPVATLALTRTLPALSNGTGVPQERALPTVSPTELTIEHGRDLPVVVPNGI